MRALFGEDKSSWSPPPKALRLGDNEVHVWRAHLDRSRTQDLCSHLSQDERNRADRFRFEADRMRFVAARGRLRTILSRYLHVDPEQLCFQYNTHGKPALAPTPGRDQLSFNMSHSSALALYAVTQRRRIGIDIEQIRNDLDYAGIVAHFFSPQERAELEALPAASQPGAFFACWTRKEAYIKARGEGLSIPLDQFSVSLKPDEPARLLSVAGDLAEASRWRLRSIDPGLGCCAALAVEGHSWHLECWQA